MARRGPSAKGKASRSTGISRPPRKKRRFHGWGYTKSSTLYTVSEPSKSSRKMSWSYSIQYRAATLNRTEMDRVEGTSSAGRHDVAAAKRSLQGCSSRERVQQSNPLIEPCFNTYKRQRAISDARLGARAKLYREYSERAATTHRAEMERVEGIEPSWPAWKAGTLPLSYTRKTDANHGTTPHTGQ